MARPGSWSSADEQRPYTAFDLGLMLAVLTLSTAAVVILGVHWPLLALVALSGVELFRICMSGRLGDTDLVPVKTKSVSAPGRSGNYLKRGGQVLMGPLQPRPQAQVSPPPAPPR